MKLRTDFQQPVKRRFKTEALGKNSELLKTYYVKYARIRLKRIETESAIRPIVHCTGSTRLHIFSTLAIINNIYVFNLECNANS